MRYPAVTDRGQTVPLTTRYNPGSRPPLEELPPKLATLLRERDRIEDRRRAAAGEVQRLSGDDLSRAAQRADDQAAAAAARADKPVPAPAATPRLEAERADAARNLAAQEAALHGITEECYELTARLHEAGQAARAAEYMKQREHITALANQLADAVEAVIASRAATYWMRAGHYVKSATTWPIDVIPELTRHGLTRHGTTPHRIRDLITNAALTGLTNGA